MSTWQRQIRDVVAAQNIRIYQPPIEVDDEASAEHARILAEAMPFSIIGSTEDVQTPDGRVVKGREYLWGVAEGHPSPDSILSITVLTRWCSGE
jgi:cell division control protein 12